MLKKNLHNLEKGRKQSHDNWHLLLLARPPICCYLYVPLHSHEILYNRLILIVWIAQYWFPLNWLRLCNMAKKLCNMRFSTSREVKWLLLYSSTCDKFLKSVFYYLLLFCEIAASESVGGSNSLSISHSPLSNDPENGNSINKCTNVVHLKD